MSSETTENPVMLWGDMGPDVYKLSQIYDPRNDKYVQTQDSVIAPGTDYYERLSLILTSDENVHDGRQYYYREVDSDTGAVTFKKVESYSAGDNPQRNGWYQDSGGKVLVFSKVDLTKHPETTSPVANFWFVENPDPVNTCGKYVPEVDSLVVVDEPECEYKIENNYKTRMLLTVKSVDRALNVTFATVIFGSETEETIRAIDYGNEKFMLFFDRKDAGVGNIKLTPDRKLLLYGKNTYGYRLKRDGAIISSNIPTIQVKDDAFIPYARAIAKRTTLSETNWEAIQGKLLDVVLPTGLQRVVSAPNDKTLLIPTCDITFRAYVRYYTEAGVQIPTSDFTVGESIHLWEENDAARRRVYRPAFRDDNTWINGTKWNGDLIDRVAYVHDDPDAAVGSVFVPESCYLKSNNSIVDGESILMEIFSFDTETNHAHMVMSLTLIAKEAAALDTTDITTRQITNFDVELNGNDNAGDIWYLQQGDNWKSAFHMTPKITFDDGSDMSVPIDNKTCYVYGLEDIKSKLIGKEYQILFKFFPHKRLNVDWQKVGMTPTKNFVVCRKTVKIINDLSNKIRKISLIPAWNQTAQMYQYYFMIFRTDFAAPPIIRTGIETKYQVQTYKVTTDIYARKYTAEDGAGIAGQMKRYYRKLNSGNFLDLNLLEGTDLRNVTYTDDSGHTQRVTVYETTVQPKTSLYDIQYMKESGNKTTIPTANAGSLFDTVQHAIMSEMVYADNMSASSLYKQPVAFKVQNLMLSDPSRDNPLTPWLIGDDCTGWTEDTLPYGNKNDGRPYLLYTLDHTEHIEDVDVNVGNYQVDRSVFDTVEKFLTAFYENSQPPKGTAFEAESGESVLTELFQPTHFYLRSCSDDVAVSGLVAIKEPVDGDSGNLYTPISMTGGGSAATTIGGAQPAIIEDYAYGLGQVKLMGTVIVEFVHQYVDPEDTTKYKYKHLFAVPVEVRDTAW